MLTKPRRMQNVYALAAEAFLEAGENRRARRIKAALEAKSINDDPQNCPLHKVSELGLRRTKNLCGDYSSMGPLCSGCSVGKKEAEEKAKAGGGASE